MVDEASGVSEEIYEAIEGCMTSARARLLLIGNPTRRSGTFFRAFHEERALWYQLHISAPETPNLTSGSDFMPGLVTRKWVDEAARKWGEQSPIYQIRVLGDFPSQSIDRLLSLTTVEAAVKQTSNPADTRSRESSQVLPDSNRDSQTHPPEDVQLDARSAIFGTPNRSPLLPPLPSRERIEVRGSGGAPNTDGSTNDSAPSPLEEPVLRHSKEEGWGEGLLLLQASTHEGAEDAPIPFQSRESGPIFLGVDVARFGADRTAICVQQNNTVIALDAYHRQNTMETAGRVAAAIYKYTPTGVRIDEIGVGAGVVDRLKELGYDCIEGVNVSNRATDPDKFANLRAELFDNLRELFERQQIEIPNDPDLISQLTSIRYSFASTGQIKIEDKETLRRNGLPSPDLADALVLAFAPETPRNDYVMYTGSPLERPENQHKTPAARLSLLAQEGIDLDTLTIRERRRYNNWIDTGSWGPTDE